MDHPVKDSYKQETNKHPDMIIHIKKIENVYEDMKSRSIRIIEPLQEMSFGRGFHIADPDANIIAFVEENNS